MDWLDLLAVQGTLKSLLQHHSSKASILQHSVFFMVTLTHLYMTTRKTIALTRWTFVDKVMSLFFNMLSRFVIAFLPRNKSFHFMAAVTTCSDFGAQENLSMFPSFPPLILIVYINFYWWKVIHHNLVNWNIIASFFLFFPSTDFKKKLLVYFSQLCDIFIH